MYLNKSGILYNQIKDEIAKRIVEEFYPVGSLLPSETLLVEEFKVSKITIRKAVELLSNEGWVEKKAGIGTRIICDSPASKLQKGQKFTEILIEDGHTITKKIRSVEIVKNCEDSELFKYFGKEAIRITREFYLDDKPYIFFCHYLPNDKGLPTTKKSYQSSLYSTLSKKGIQLHAFEDHFYAENAPSEVKSFLNKEVLLGRKRYAYDQFRNVVEITNSHYETTLKNYIIRFNV